MGLFDRKYCDICGAKLGLILGHRKLEDGTMCKDCEEKLSPFFMERKVSTVAEIKEQLEYRERNRMDVAAFNTTATYGTGTKIYLDENARKFMVTSASNLHQANPDVIRFDQITGCRVDVQERKHEMKRRDAEGNQVSYDPPIYSRSYDFYMIIDVNSPYFNEIRFKLNNREVEIEPEIRVAREPLMRGQRMPQPSGRPEPVKPVERQAARPVQPSQQSQRGERVASQNGPRGNGGASPIQRTQPEQGRGVSPVQRPGQGVQPVQRPVQAAQPVQRPGQGAQPAQRPGQAAQPQASQRYVAGRIDPFQDADYCRYAEMAEEIRGLLTGIREEIRSGAYGYQPAQAVVCESCGATTMGNEDGCCEYCGSPL